jgi:peptidoglycan hydrolase-like protein with peptidoglycan-binding domain
MKTVARLHLAATHNESPMIDSDSNRTHGQFFARWNWRELSSYALLRLLPVAATIAVLSIASAALAIPVRRGNSGSEVANIQRCLRQLRYYNGPTNGRFGSLTESAVIRFQRDYGVRADGVVGSSTQRVLQSQCPNIDLGGNPSGILRRGSRGEAVRKLQQDLQKLGYFNERATGTFGPVTEAAVINFQQDHGLPANGIVDTRTQNLILARLDNPNDGVGSDYPTLRRGSRGGDVTFLQQRLQQLGYLNRTPTGLFGTETERAVIRFQRDYQLDATGVVDAQTWDVLLDNNQEKPDERRTLRQGDEGEDVKELQERLNELGYLNMRRPTGRFGVVTRDAVINFQRDNDLNPTGVVDSRTWRKLGVSSASKNRDRYVVVVPVRDSRTLTRVRRFVPNALPQKSRLGDFVNAGNFSNWASAERLSSRLRGGGLDARVVRR